MEMLDRRSRMSGDVHVRICEHLGGRFPGVTRRVLFSNTKSELWEWKEALELYLQQFRLILNAQRTELYPSTEGKCFLGQKVFQLYRLLPAENVRRAKKRIQCTIFSKPETMQQRLAGWVGHASQANTRKLLRSLGLVGRQSV